MKEILGKQQQLGDLSAFIFFNESGSHMIENLFGLFFQYKINYKQIIKCSVNNSKLQHKFHIDDKITNNLIIRKIIMVANSNIFSQPFAKRLFVHTFIL